MLSFTLQTDTVFTVHAHARIINEALIPKTLYKTLSVPKEITYFIGAKL